MMATLKPSSRFALSPVAAPIFRNPINSNFVRIPSPSFSRAIPSLGGIKSNKTTNNAVVIAEGLTNVTTPWLMLPSVVDESTGEMLDCFYSLADNETIRVNRNKVLKVPDSAKCFGSAMSWLGFVDPIDCSVYLSNPFLKDVVHLPSLETLPSVLGVQRDPDSGSLLNFKVRLQNFEVVWGTQDIDLFMMLKPEHMAWHISHLALSSAYPRELDAVVMAVQGHDTLGRLAFCPISRRFSDETDFDVVPGKRGRGDTWIGLQEDYDPGLPYNQVVYSDKTRLFYTLFEKTGLQGFDVHRDRGQRSRMVCQYTWEKLEQDLKMALEDVKQNELLTNLRSICRKKYYLVNLTNGDLLLIVRYYEYKRYEVVPLPHHTRHFDVFRIGFPSSVEHLTTLGNRAIFIGSNQSFCLKGCPPAGIRPNCIYFTDDIDFTNVHSAHTWGHDIGIFSMDDNLISPCYPYEDTEKEKKIPISSVLFWVAPPLAYGLLSHLDPELESTRYCQIGY